MNTRILWLYFVRFCFVSTIVFAGGNLVADQSLPWPLAPNGGLADPRVEWGRLENGFRYAILPTDAHPGELSLRLLVCAGSSDEEEGELGYAHLVEHMAFKETDHFNAKSLREFFVDSGLSFGSHANAWTSVSSTGYKIDLKKVSDERLQKSLLFFRDVAMGIHFAEEEVGLEVNVVLEEKRIRELDHHRSHTVERWKFMLDNRDQRYSDPIGKEDVLEKANAESLRNFWDKWYRPDNMILFVTGDVEVESMGNRIQEKFADFVSRTDFDGERIGLPEASDSEVRARFFSKPYERVVHSMTFPLGDMDLFDPEVEKKYKALVFASKAVQESKYYTYFLSRRFQRTFLMTQVSYKNRGDWDSGLINLQRNRKRLYRDGIEPWAFEHALVMEEEELLNSISADELEEPVYLADHFEKSVEQRKPFRTGRFQVEFLRNHLDTLNLDRLNELVRENLNPQKVDYFVWLEGSKNKDPEEIISTAKMGQWIWSPGKGRKESKEVALKTEFGKSAKILEKERFSVGWHEGLRARLSNGIRLNVVRTDLESGFARMHVGFGSGIGGLEEVFPGAPVVGDRVVKEMKIDRFQGKGLKSTLNRNGIRNVDTGMLVDSGYIYALVVGEKGLKGGCSYITEWLEESALAKRSYKWALNNVKDELSKDDTEEFIYHHLYPETIGSDWRLLEPSASVVENFDREMIEEWVADEVRNGYCEVSIVGDVDLDTALENAIKTFGSLQKRMDSVELGAFEEEIAHAGGGILKKKLYQKGTVRSQSVFHVPISVEGDYMKRQTAIMLSKAVDHALGMKIREEMGLSYSIQFLISGEMCLEGSFALIGEVSCASEDAVDIARLIHFYVPEYVAGLTLEELERLGRPYIEERMRQTEDNQEIVQLIKRLQREPEYMSKAIEWTRYLEGPEFEKDFEELKSDIIAEKVNTLAFYNRVSPEEDKKTQ